MTAIVYCSQTGHTAQYAKLLSQRLELPAYRLGSAEDAVPKGSDVIFLTWLCAGVPKQWKKAFALWNVRAMGVIGMVTAGESQLTAVAQRCHLGKAFPLFYLPGGYDKQALHGIYRLLMNAMEKQQRRLLSSKAQLTPNEQEALKLWQFGGSLVDPKHLAGLAAYCQQL